MQAVSMDCRSGMRGAGAAVPSPLRPASPASASRPRAACRRGSPPPAALRRRAAMPQPEAAAAVGYWRPSGCLYGRSRLLMVWSLVRRCARRNGHSERQAGRRPRRASRHRQQQQQKQQQQQGRASVSHANLLHPSLRRHPPLSDQAAQPPPTLESSCPGKPLWPTCSSQQNSSSSSQQSQQSQ